MNRRLTSELWPAKLITWAALAFALLCVQGAAARAPQDLNDSPRAQALVTAARDYLPADWRYPTSDRPVPGLLGKLLTSALPVTVREQPNDYTCGSASLGILLSSVAIDRSESRLERLTHTTTDGAEPESLVEAALALGVPAQGHVDGSVAELCAALRQGRPSIIDYQVSYTPKDDPTDDWGHYSVVVAADAADLLIVDPSQTNPAHLRIIPKAELPAIWWDTTVDTHRRFERWMMTLGRPTR